MKSIFPYYTTTLKKALRVVVFILITLPVNAQYFSKHYPLYAGTNGYISSIQVVNDTIYAMCFVGDSLNPVYSIAAFERFDKYGNRISYNPVTMPTLINIWANSNTLIHTRDDGFVYGGYINIDSTQNALVVLKYDHYGNLQWYREIYDSTSLSFGCQAIIEDSFSNYYLTGTIQHLNYDEDIYIIKTDSSGNLTYKKVFLHPNFDDAAFGICFNERNHIILGGDAFSYNGSNFTTAKDYMEIYELDTAGNQLNYVLGSDTNGPQAYGILSSEDGGYLIVSSYICSRDVNGNTWQGSIAKLDSNFHEVWKIDMGPCSQMTGFYAQKKCPDGNYITVGEWHDDKDTVASHINGWIVKYSGNGQIIWSKLYRSISATDLRGDDNDLRSIGFLSDNSIICAGQAETNDLTVSPDQQGWLLHLDTAGCLPDSNICGLPDGIVNIHKAMASVRVYPNPTSDKIQIEVLMDQPMGCRLLITDLLGQIMSEIYLPQSNSAQTIDVRDWPMGLYLYNVASKEGVINSGRFIVNH